ncbi:MAG: hypothetical protein AAF318_08935 [Pseudomonadota bacterium]
MALSLPDLTGFLTIADDLEEFVAARGVWDRIVFTGAVDAAHFRGGFNTAIFHQTVDTVTTGNKADAFYFLSDAKDIFAGHGDNLIASAGAIEAVYAGNGDDTVILDGTSEGAVLQLGHGDNTVSAHTGVIDELVTGAGADVATIRGASYVDLGAGDNTMDATHYIWRLFTREGDDTVTLGLRGEGAGADAGRVSLGQGDDTLTATNWINIVNAGGGDDHITLAAGGSKIALGPGHDTLVNGAWFGQILAGHGNDTVTVGNGANISLGSGHDWLVSAGAIATLDTGRGSDRVDVLGGADAVSMGRGADILGQEGVTGVIGIVTSLNMGGGHDAVHDLEGAGSVALGHGNDTLSASGDVGVLDAGNGHDVITVTAGATVYGGKGWDTLKNGTGATFLMGDGGRDTFHFTDDASNYDYFDGGTGRDTLVVEVTSAERKAELEALFAAHADISDDLKVNNAANLYFETLRLEIDKIELIEIVIV